MSIGARRTVQIAFAGIIITLLVGYGLFQARDLLAGPQITVNSPTDGALLRSPLVQVTGNAENITSIELNDRNITVNQKGRFKEPVVLAQGYNVVTIEATDRFGRTVNKKMEFIHRPLSSNNTELSQTSEKAGDSS
jgi:formylmethanofuran dehydrogenase subunit C